MKRKPILYNMKGSAAAFNHPGNFFVPIVEKAKHSVISIETKDRGNSRQSDFLFSFLFPNSESVSTTKSFGTGFIIHSSGFILTSEHVVHNAQQILVKLYSGEQRVAKVVWSDEKRDLAVLQIPTRKPLFPLPLGSSEESRVGELVISVGNPMGLDHTVTIECI
ncbi:MAG TPA: trypsin-like peptidase domain-containing protein [Bacillota bacterium]|nr:trypsin-like peptidase domain-containing protein [Bacillota bacterium]